MFSHVSRRPGPLLQEFQAPEFFPGLADERRFLRRRCNRADSAGGRHRCDPVGVFLQLAFRPSTNLEISVPGVTSTGAWPRRKILAPVWPFSVTVPLLHNTHAPSRMPTTGVSFSSRNCRIREG